MSRMPAEDCALSMMRSTSTVVFRTDASPSIGGGHGMRCLALANALRSAGVACSFACSQQTSGSVPALAGSGYRCLGLDAPADAETLRRAMPDGCDWLGVDHYGWDAAHETRW